MATIAQCGSSRTQGQQITSALKRVRCRCLCDWKVFSSEVCSWYSVDCLTAVFVSEKKTYTVISAHKVCCQWVRWSNYSVLSFVPLYRSFFPFLSFLLSFFFLKTFIVQTWKPILWHSVMVVRCWSWIILVETNDYPADISSEEGNQGSVILCWLIKRGEWSTCVFHGVIIQTSSCGVYD